MKNLFKERFSELLNACPKQQIEIAKDLNVSKQQLTKWKLGQLEPNMDNLIMIAEYFDVTTDYLLGRTDDY